MVLPPASLLKVQHSDKIHAFNLPGSFQAALNFLWQVSSMSGVRCWVHGKLSDSQGLELASCDAQLVDLQPLKKVELLRQQRLAA